MPTVLPILASIPSPSDNSIKIGPVELRAYGLAIALGVVAAVWISRRRWAARGGDPDDISRIALWAVAAGLIGARIYHVLTDLDRFEGRWLHVFAVWEGGLGIPGGLIAGVLTGAYVAHRRGLPVSELLDVVAPALPVAQAIGRLGNWFNQELFGRPTDLPWGLEIDPAHRPPGYLNVTTFHPTFLYEALWNLALAGGLVLWERHHPRSRPGRLFALYVAGYAVGRAWIEALRIDPAAHLFGVRWNIWMSAIAFFAAVGWLVFDSWRARQEADRKAGAATTTDATTATGATDAGQPDATETAEARGAEPADQSDAGEPGDPSAEPSAPSDDPAAKPSAPSDASQSDVGEPGDRTAGAAGESPTADEPAAADEPHPGDGPAGAGERAAGEAPTADEPAADQQPDTEGTSGTSAAGQAPAVVAGNDPEAGGVTNDHRVAGNPGADSGPSGEPGGGAPAGREPGGTRSETADEEAAT